MIQEDKDLLFKDLCARLPYGTKCIVTKSRTEEGQKGDVGRIVRVCLEGVDCIDNTVFFSEFGNFKPYLFPLSSMTKEQQIEANIFDDMDMDILSQNLGRNHRDKTNIPTATYNYIDWLNKNHFDYRGLIERGLAIDATGQNIY